MRLEEYISERAVRVQAIRHRGAWTTNEQIFNDVKRMIIRNPRLRRHIAGLELVEGFRIRVDARSEEAEQALIAAMSVTKMMMFPDDETIPMLSVTGVGDVDGELSIVLLRAGSSIMKGKTSNLKAKF